MWQDLKTLWVLKPFRRLFLARVISNFGNGLGPVALAFGVLGLEGATATDLSKVQASLMLPLVVFMLIGGVVADRFPRALVVASSDILLSVFVITSGILFLTDTATIPKLMFIAFVSGTLNALWWPAFIGITPEIVPEENLQSANSVIAFGANSMNIFGLVAGGLLVSTVGPGWAIVIDGISFLIAGILVMQLRKFGKHRDTSEHTPTAIEELIHGWKEFSTRSWVVAVVAGYTIIAMAIESVFAVLGPYNAKLNLEGARPWSWVMASLSIGMALGVVVAMRIRPKHPLVLGLGVQVALVAWIVTMGITSNIWLIMLAGFLCGIGMDLFFILWQTALQTHIPRESLSRVASYDAFGSLALAPLGLVLAGPAAEKFGVENTLIGLGAVCAIALVAMLAVPGVRKLEAIEPATEVDPGISSGTAPEPVK
jgi:MFS family permease